MESHKIVGLGGEASSSTGCRVSILEDCESSTTEMKSLQTGGFEGEDYSATGKESQPTGGL